MTASAQTGTKSGSWVAVALAWTAVGVPLAWGVFQTCLKAAALFR